MKRTLLNISAAALVASSTALFAACAVDVDRSEKENVSGETVGALSSFKDLGEIPGTGEPRTAKYSNPPRYSAYTFYADKGQEVDVWVKGAKGSDDDAVAWVIDAKDKTLGYDDDADVTTLDAHITLKAPNAATKSKYLVVFRDYYLDRATFTVTVLVKPLGCSYGGHDYAAGDSFKSTDGCNTCVCTAGGGVGCTKMACLPPKCDEATEPNRKYVGHSPDQCKLVKFACEPGTAMFSNDCGCGCEQPSDCPSSINCMPGPGDASAKCAALRAKCPYTPVAF